MGSGFSFMKMATHCRIALMIFIFWYNSQIILGTLYIQQLQSRYGILNWLNTDGTPCPAKTLVECGACCKMNRKCNAFRFVKEEQKCLIVHLWKVTNEKPFEDAWLDKMHIDPTGIKSEIFLLAFNFSLWLFNSDDTFFLFQSATKYRSQKLTSLTLMIAYPQNASLKITVRNGFWKMKNLVMCITKTFGLPKRELTINLSSLIWVAIAISGKLKSSTTLIHLGIS